MTRRMLFSKVYIKRIPFLPADELINVYYFRCYLSIAKLNDVRHCFKDEILSEYRAEITYPTYKWPNFAIDYS